MEVKIRITSWRADHNAQDMYSIDAHLGKSTTVIREARPTRFQIEFYCKSVPLIKFDEVLYLTDTPIVSLLEEVSPKELNQVIETLSKDSKLRKILENFVLDTSKKILRE